MTTNPMQRKARNSFLAGMLITLIITGAIIGFLTYMLINQKKAERQEELAKTSIYTLNKDVKSGQIITPDMLNLVSVTTDIAPKNAVDSMDKLVEYSLMEKSTGNMIATDENGLYVADNGNKVRIAKDEASGNYYKAVNNQKVLVEFLDVPLVAKVDMAANSVVTLDLVARSNEVANDDLRLTEYNMLMLPVKLNVDDYIDIRFTLPSGQNYIVVSKKRVVDVLEDTVWLKMSEEETLTLSNAIVEAYIMTGSKLTVNLYVEPGLQEASIPTYAVSQDVLALIEKDPNIRQEAKQALFKQYNDQGLVNQRTNIINGQIQKYEDQLQGNIESRVQAENESRRELREKYLEELSAAAAAATVEVVE